MELLTTEKSPPQPINHVGVLLTNDQEVRSLNNIYRKLDKTTDVLSFSMLEGEGYDSADSDLGDIVISLEMALKQSKRFKCSFEKEILRLLIHGSLHLFGYDHVNVSMKRVKLMRDLEAKLIRKYGGDL